MHWFSDEVESLGEMAGARRDATPSDRRLFLHRLEHVVEGVASRHGVHGAFASFEGLLVAAAGNPPPDAPDFESLAALAQRLLEPCADAWESRALGDVRQLLVVGTREKLVLVCVGPVVLGVTSAVTVRLAEATA